MAMYHATPPTGSSTLRFNGNSDYIKSLLLPHTGPASIPDDYMRKHHLKQESTTYNIPVPASGSGLFLLYPNSAGTYIGAHYSQSGSTLTFDRELRVAQNLGDAYDWGRKISQRIDIRSTTVAAGTFQLGGTFNGVTYEGTTAEILPLSYNTILSNVVDPLDKIENVAVYDGVSILSLPTTFDRPYVRLTDKMPSDYPYATAPANKTYGAVHDASSGIMYQSVIGDGGNAAIYPDPIPINTGGGFAIETASINIDCTADQAFAINGWIEFWSQSNQNIAVKNISAFADFFDVSGNKLFDIEISMSSTTAPFYSLSYVTGGHGIRVPLSFASSMRALIKSNSNKFTQSLAGSPAVTCKFYFGFANYNTAIAGGDLVFTQNIGLTVFNSNYGGYNSPVTALMYQGMSAGQTLTVTGWSNFELVPNPELQKNLTLDYPVSDPDEMRHLKLLLSNRKRLGLSTMSKVAAYEAREALYLELAQVGTSSGRVAEAFGFGDIFKFIRDKILPVASMIPGPIGAISQGVSQLANGLSGSAMSGRPLNASAMSGAPLATAADHRMLGASGHGRPLANLNPFVSRAGGRHALAMDTDPERLTPEDIPLVTRVLTGDSVASMVADADDPDQVEDVIVLLNDDAIPHSVAEAKLQQYFRPVKYAWRTPEQVGSLHVINLKTSNTSAAMFPVIEVSSDNILEVKGESLYAAVKGNFSSKINVEGGMVSTDTIDGYKIYGYKSDTRYPLRTFSDITLVQLVGFEGPLLTAASIQLPVSGTSLQLAVSVCVRLQPGCMPPFVFTGGMSMRDKKLYINPNPAIRPKHNYTKSISLPLIANDPHVELPAISLRVLMKTLNRGAKESKYRRLPAPASKPGHIAMAMDEFLIDTSVPEDYTHGNQYLQPNIATEAIRPTVVDYQVPSTSYQQPQQVYQSRPNVMDDPDWRKFNDMQNFYRQEYPDYGAMIDVMERLVSTGVMTLLQEEMRRDPQFKSIAASLSNRMQQPVSEKKLYKAANKFVVPQETLNAQQQAQQAKAQRIATGQQASVGTLITSGPAITAEWILANGNRGLDQQQMAYLRANHKLPPPKGAVKQAPWERIADSMQVRTPEGRRLIHEFYLSKGRGPDGIETAQLRGNLDAIPGEARAVKSLAVAPAAGPNAFARANRFVRPAQQTDLL